MYMYMQTKMDGPKRKNRVCCYCKQELSHAAYYRHMSDKSSICPGRSQSAPDKEGCLPHSPSSSEEDPLAELDLDSDSSFDFGDAGLSLSDMSTSPCVSPMIIEQDRHVYDSDESQEDSGAGTSESDSDDPGIELRDESDEEEDADGTIGGSNLLVHGITLFLTAVQLFFRIPDRAMHNLLVFLRILFRNLAETVGHPLLHLLCKLLPKSMQTSRKSISTSKDGVVDYAVCPKCCSIYKLAECYETVNGKKCLADRLCNYIEYPSHPHQSKRVKCNTPLMKRVKVGNTYKLAPKKVFQYCSIEHSLQLLIERKGFIDKCNLWRNRSIPENMLADIFDGEVWKSLNNGDGAFLNSPCNFCFTLNVDWFNPYKHTKHSSGGIYLAIQNLPRADRQKIDNIILVGMIPGPKEPEKDINSFLSPFVEELKTLYEGVALKNCTVRAMLTCVSADLPATRKVCGFLSYSAKLGCSKCLKQFPTFHGRFHDKQNYSGYEVDTWEPRQTSLHRVHATKIKEAKHVTAEEALQSKHGLRYSVLLDLPYFDVVRYHTVDPMHNLFLGIGKKTTKTWVKLNILTDRKLKEIQAKIDSMNPPPNIGRIPRKISSGFSSFTADEWKHWILIYSLYALHGILPGDDFNCWYLFVEACKKMCQTVITREDILEAHKLLVEFCESYQKRYGLEACTPNMHMACHLKDSMLDYGPLPAFWCFSFERYNGTLEGMAKSWLEPEKQMLSKFRNLQALKSATESISDSGNEFAVEICGLPMFQPGKTRGSVEQTLIDSSTILKQNMYHTCAIPLIDATEKDYETLLPPVFEKPLNDSEMDCLSDMYSFLYPQCSNLELCRFYMEGKQVEINGEHYISRISRSKRSAGIVAHWATSMGIDQDHETCLFRPGIVMSFFQHKVKLDETVTKVHLLCRVQWYQQHTHQDTHIPTLVITSTLFDPPNCASFMPVCRIAGRCAIATTVATFDHGEENVCVCVPLPKQVLV